MTLWMKRNKKGELRYIAGRGKIFHPTRNREIALDEDEIPEDIKEKYERKIN